MKYTKESLQSTAAWRSNISPEYKSACKSLDMWMCRKFGRQWDGRSYCRGAISESRDCYWFAPPIIDGYSCGYSWASVHKNGTFGVVFSYAHKTYVIEAKIPCDKLHWEIKEMEY
ncbi:MAG: hypothetical protein IJQ84_06195 [Paludibacteraceae bacterium]|nr:hypothetical protein [Paludibacteraceae bacterium]